MTSRKRSRSIPRVVKVQYITAPNARERLSRAIAILLKAGTKEKTDER